MKTNSVFLIPKFISDEIKFLNLSAKDLIKVGYEIYSLNLSVLSNSLTNKNYAVVDIPFEEHRKKCDFLTKRVLFSSDFLSEMNTGFAEKTSITLLAMFFCGYSYYRFLDGKDQELDFSFLKDRKLENDGPIKNALISKRRAVRVSLPAKFKFLIGAEENNILRLLNKGIELLESNPEIARKNIEEVSDLFINRRKKDKTPNFKRNVVPVYIDHSTYLRIKSLSSLVTGDKDIASSLLVALAFINDDTNFL